MEVKISTRCYESQHLTACEYGILNVLLRLTCGGKRTLALSSAKITEKFSSLTVEETQKAKESLIKQGWLIPISNKDEYRVLNHEEWVLRHGSERCSKPKFVVTKSEVTRG